MPATVNGGGDRLARGAVRVDFRASDNVSQEKWNDIFGADSGPKKNYTDGGSGGANSASTGTAGAVSPKTRRRKQK